MESVQFSNKTNLFRWRGNSTVMQSFCVLCQRLLESLGEGARSYAQEILKIVCVTFETHFLPEARQRTKLCIQCLNHSQK